MNNFWHKYQSCPAPLAKFAITAELDTIRSFSLVLLRWLLFRVSPAAPAPFDALRLAVLQRLFLNLLSNEHV
jgi:hypothetical protein